MSKTHLKLSPKIVQGKGKNSYTYRLLYPT